MLDGADPLDMTGLLATMLTLGSQHTSLRFPLSGLQSTCGGLHGNKVMSCSSSSRGSSPPSCVQITDLYSHDELNSSFVRGNARSSVNHRTDILRTRMDHKLEMCFLSDIWSQTEEKLTPTVWTSHFLSMFSNL